MDRQVSSLLIYHPDARFEISEIGILGFVIRSAYVF
jgi:hypothetical protein